MNVPERSHGRRSPEDEHAWYKLNAIKAAKDLRYPEDIIQRLEKCNTDIEITRIMASARNNGLMGKR